jgi:glutathione S-transferase
MMKSAIASLLILVSSLSTSAFALAVSSSSSTSPTTKLQLKYFDIKGAAETCRVLLALGGEEYTDTRYQMDPKTFQSPQFLEDKTSGVLRMNLNRAPILITPSGHTIGQSKAIERYIARKCNLMGQTSEEEAIIDCIAEHCRDVKDAAMRKRFSKFVKDRTDEDKAKDRTQWFTEDMPLLLSKIEQSVTDISTCSGYTLGDTPCYADVAIWALLRDCSDIDLDDTTMAAAECKSLNAIANQIASHPGVAKWLAERPKSTW